MTSLKGKLLIAMPGISDPRFGRSVILVCAHTDEFAMGLTLNKPIDTLTMPDLFRQLGIEGDIKRPQEYVLNGGPVGTDRGFVIHGTDYFNDGSTIDVTESLNMTASRDVLEAMASSEAPAQATMTLGYSGWGGGQLEQELSENAWLIADADPELVFDAAHSRKWEDALLRMGISPALLHAEGGSA